MTDRELLKLAAKAAGFADAEWAAEQASICTVQIGNGFRPFWNPLTDSGDAFRLALQLGIVIDTTDGVHIQYTINGTAYPITIYEFDDLCKTTRLAITRAAAEIGKSMK